MQPTAEIAAFIDRITVLQSGAGVSLGAALQPSLDEEAELRKIFATDRQNARLANPHVGLVDVFDAPDAIRTTRARVVQGPEDLSAKYVMPLSDEKRRKEGAPCMVADLEEFKKNWTIFTEGSLSQLLDWNNVVAAGGSVLACLTPLDEDDKKSKRAIRKHYHSYAYPTSDIDLFLWGMTPEQAEIKIKSIYEAVRDSVPWDVTCIRTKHTVSIHSQYPYRSVQIVLRLYQSPGEILAGFDVDAPCCAYDGNHVWANPRAVVAMMRQCNTVDMTRRSPSYEVRLAKYSQRAFEVYVPTLKREEVDPTIYERSIAKMEGLARLLVLEKLTDDNMRLAFLKGRRALRGRPGSLNSYNRRNKRKYKGDLKVETGVGLEMNDYDVASLHIPYGPGWDARRIDKLVYQTDLGMHSTFNPKNKGRRLHRHPAFFGTVEECLEDCCENCPKPIDDDERKLQAEEDETYVRGRIEFIEGNPGRQSISGSFNPIDVGEWSDQVYVKPTEQLFTAIAAHDRTIVQKLIKEGVDINQRDHVGRTSLHVAIFSKAADIAGDLIHAGARITARLADGKAPLHLAAMYDQTALIQKLLARNEINIEETEKKQGKDDVMDDAVTKEAPERPSSEDDWSSHEEDDIEMTDADEGSDEDDEDDDDDSDNSAGNTKIPAEVEEDTPSGDLPEDEEDEPDIIDINIHDWDFGFSALSYAILFGSMPTLEALLSAGADVKLASKPAQGVDSFPLHPLTLTILREDEDEACKIAERLLKAGATSSTANEQMRTIFQAAVDSGRHKLSVLFPVVTAIQQKQYATLVVMLAHGEKLDLDEADITRAQEAAAPGNRGSLFGYAQVKNYLQIAYQPVEVALRNHDDISKLLIALGASVDFGLKRAVLSYSNMLERRTLKDWVDFAVNSLSDSIKKKEAEEIGVVAVDSMDVDADAKPQEERTGWKQWHKKHYYSLRDPDYSNKVEKDKEDKAKADKEALERMEDIRYFLGEVQELLSAHNAKTWKEVYPDIETSLRPIFGMGTTKVSQPESDYDFMLLSSGYEPQNVPQHLKPAYDELYEACYAGDNDKIQRLCLPVPGQAVGAPTPLNISVKMVDRSTRYSSKGYTPLFAAISGRRWSTAQLILAIATAQYQPDDDADKVKFDTDIDMDDDSDDESCDSEDSNITVEQVEVKFIDIATRPSAVRSDIHPKVMLQAVPIPWRKPRPAASEPPFVGPESGTAHPLLKAVVDHDLEAFVHIANLYDSLQQPLPLGADVLQAIVEQDQPGILDEYIRRTGAGVDVAGARKESGDTEPIPVATNDENKKYLGLNVHGKKRADLASKNDPDADDMEERAEPPLLWTAAKGKARGIVSYLGSDRPFAAYKFYATTHVDSKAIWLTRLGTDPGGELEKRLPAWLGWTINVLGESPLSAAIIGGDLDVVKLLAKLNPKLMAQAVQTNIKFVGTNPLLLAVHTLVDTKLIDYLLSRKISPTDKDLIRGWNIYHYVCDHNHGDLLQHFLSKLPSDVNEALLAQQSKISENTPLHVAVKRGNKALVSLLLAYAKNSLLVKDVDGRTPLHCAVAGSLADITKQLLAVSPPNAIHIENGVGNTPLEMAVMAELIDRMKKYTAVLRRHSDFDIRPTVADVDPARIQLNDIEKLETELSKMREAVASMIDRGTISEKGKAKLKLEVGKWVEGMEKEVEVLKVKKAETEEKEAEEKKRQKEKEEEKEKDNDQKYPGEAADVRATLDLILEAAHSTASGPGQRQLIHLLDVQQSVSATLAKVGKLADEDNYHRRHRRRDDEFEQEEDEDTQLRENSVMFQYVSIGDDPL